MSTPAASYIKKLGKDALVYGFGGILTRAFSFLLLPIYTRSFSPAEYGSLETMAMITLFMSSILTLGLDSALSFYFFKEKQNGLKSQKEIISAIFQWNMTVGLGICLIASYVLPHFSHIFFTTPIPTSFFFIAFMGLFFSLIFNQMLNVFRLLYKPWPYILLTALNSVLNALIVISMIFLFKQGILSFFIGTALATLVTMGITCFLLRDFIDFSTHYSSHWPRLLKFGLPLLPGSFSYYWMNASDRWILLKYYGPDTLGLYSVSLKFGLAITFAVEMFRKAWWPIAMETMHLPHGPQTFRFIARAYMALGITGVIFLTYLSPSLTKLLVGPAFQSAWILIGVLAWQSVFYGFYLIASAGIWKAEKTYLASYLLAFASLLNLILNLCFVPRLGALGAALATSLTYFIWILLALWLSSRLWPTKISILTFVLQVVIGTCATVLLTYARSNSPLQNSLVVIFMLLTLFVISSQNSERQFVWKKSKGYLDGLSKLIN